MHSCQRWIESLKKSIFTHPAQVLLEVLTNFAIGGIEPHLSFKQDGYTLQASAAKLFPRNRVLVYCVGQFQANLVDMTE